jgi:intergrase/recombinase
MRGIAAPETSHVSPPVKSAVVTLAAEDSKIGEAASQSSIGDRQILDYMVRLDYNIDVEKGGSLISLYCEYQEYLQENNLIDSEQAEQLRERKKVKESAPK